VIQIGPNSPAHQESVGVEGVLAASLVLKLEDRQDRGILITIPKLREFGLSPESSEYTVMKDMLKKSFLLFCILVFAICAKVSLSGNDDEAYILGLRYPKSYDEKTSQRGPDIRFVEYKVRLSFPSKDVVQFYDNKLKAIGWVPFVEPNYPKSDRKWQQFIDSTVEGRPLVHQLVAQWVNKDSTRIAGLFITYCSRYSNMKEELYEKEPNNNIQEIVVQVMPFCILPPPENSK